ncbi:MAG: bifunctional DNA-formamidopyrimidine glycosylase/DNA-(apurinic or apyrimidinic site) lyase [Bryobacteraceae bacterium]
MPELPEVEAVCRKLRESAEGRRILACTVHRCAKPSVARRVTGRQIVSVERLGKNILARLDGGETLHVHLRMTGNLYVEKRTPPPGEARVWMTLSGGRVLVFEDTRALGVVEVLRPPEMEKLRRAIGPEPLSEDFTVERLLAATRGSRQPAKLFLLDQRRVAGIGNIYAVEALYKAGIHPARLAGKLSAPRVRRLHAAIVSVLSDAVQSACIAYSGPGRFVEAETFPLAVYGRDQQPCLRCRSRIRRIVQGGRSTYFCPGCQR